MSRCDNCRYQGDTEFDACHICNNDQDMFRPIKTNGDRIRAMSDEKLAKFLAKNAGCEWCVAKPDTQDCDQCRKVWLDWLRKEAEHA